MNKIGNNKVKSDIAIKLVIFLKIIIMIQFNIVAFLIYLALGAGGMQEFGQQFMGMITILSMTGIYYVWAQNRDYKKMKRGEIDEQN